LGHDDRERMADRMRSRVEALAPGFGSRVVARRVLGPRELEAMDANLQAPVVTAAALARLTRAPLSPG
jgi:phytoene dehydrogenase-like protein